MFFFLFFRCKARLHELMKLDKDFTPEDKEKINPCNSSSISDALDFVKNPVKCCKHVHELIKNLMEIVQVKKEDPKTKGKIYISYYIRETGGIQNTKHTNNVF